MEEYYARIENILKDGAFGYQEMVQQLAYELIWYLPALLGKFLQREH
jgi:hypothetical protein